jgi:hypothetical protein
MSTIDQRRHLNVGHYPGHLRDAFVEGIERCQPGIAPIAVDAELNRIAGLVWNCTDVLPGEYCQMLDLPAGSSYAQAPRHVRAAAIG